MVVNGIASDGISYYSRVVTTLADSGPGSLRQVVADSVSGGVIRFDASLTGQTILLTSGPINLDKNLIIDGSTLTHGIWVNANASVRVLTVQPGASVTINSLILINGSDANVGGIANYGSLTLNNCCVADNVSPAGVGGINNFAIGSLTLNNCTVTVNSGKYGGIFSGGVLNMNNCTVAGNSGSIVGGLYVGLGFPQVYNTIISGNTGGTFTNFYGPFGGGNNLLDVADPMLAPIGDHGGLTPSMPPLPGSPAVDAGSDAAAAAAGLATDQRGLPRISGDHVDIGAAELQLVTSSTPAQVSSVTNLPDGSFQLGFTNLSGASFRVYAATNVALPWSNWTMIGFVSEIPAGSGQFQFNDPQATNTFQRFYRVRSP
jgi:hypothetical protein